jgi:RHS repeat-associated protein
MTSSPKVHSFSGGATTLTYDHDILGNRTSRLLSSYNDVGAAKYEWDVLNRMTKHANTANGISNRYRADGQRIEKVTGISLAWFEDEANESGYYDYNVNSDAPTDRYFYDGQMGFEDDSTFVEGESIVKTVTRYALGARGIDRLAYTNTSNATTIGYPLYDGHGNMRAVLSKSGSSYTTGNWRTYDVWGSVRSGNATGDPKQRYVASIGHVADDETGLTYMRARFYEPGTGRFVSEDPANHGENWYVYCGNQPVSRSDASGKEWDDNAYWLFGKVLCDAGSMLIRAGMAFLVLGMGMLWKIRSAAKISSIRYNVSKDIIRYRQGLAGHTLSQAAAFIAVGYLASFVGNLYMSLGEDVDELMPGLYDRIMGWIDFIKKLLPVDPWSGA